MLKFVSISILISTGLYNWDLFIPKCWYESTVENIEDIVSKNGYLLETHTANTEDGYILTLHRIPQKERKPPVFLMHGLLCTSVDWIINGPNKSMALVLAEAGYDVWLGNNRGNTYSRHHISLDPDKQKQKFFDYSYHEIGYYDLPAMIDYVLKITGYNQLTYIGYSEGFTSYLVMGSLKPEYNDKILLMNAFAPVTNLYRIKSSIFNLIGQSPILLELAEYIGWYEMFPHRSSLLKFACNTSSRLCRLAFCIIGSSEEQVPDQEFRKVILENFPAGMSLKQLTHYIQGLRSGIFGHFDYGKQKNLKVYGGPHVPLYNLKNVTTPIIFYYGEDDYLVNNDILLNSVVKELPNVKKTFLVPYSKFNHLDFIWGKEVKQLTTEALANINKYNEIG